MKSKSNEQIDIEKFYPRYYDLKCYRDHANFTEDYKLSQCLVLLTKFIENVRLNDFLVHKAVIAYTGLNNYLELLLNGRLVDTLITNEDLDFLCDHDISLIDYINYEKINPLKDRCNKICLVYDSNIDTGLFIYELRKIIIIALDIITKIDPQLHLTNKTNAWIMKPYGLSRGKCAQIIFHYKDILRILIDSDIDWIIQKYIEKPLIIHNRKVNL